MRKIYLLFTMLMVATLATYAQNRTISGVVTGEGETDPLIGVTITVKGSNIATATDVNGKYTIKVTSMQNVVIGAKYIGFQYQEFTVKPDQTVLDIKLPKGSAHDLAEVAVVSVGYGTLQKAKVLGSVAEIKAVEVEDLPVANLGTALMNRVPGVNVSVASGKPGATTTITLQGAYSFSNSGGITNEPLYIIDGLRAAKSDFDNLDASLLESISFLKDAQAAIYGAEAAQGVVLVTTKKGKPGKAQITYTGYFGVSDAAFTPKLLSPVQLATTINDVLEAQNAISTARFSQADLDFLATNPYQSWKDQLWHASQTKRHTINISGGTEKVTFFAGGNYYDEGGNFGYTAIKKYGIRSGMTAKINDDITAYASLNLTYSTDFRNGAKSENTDAQNTTVAAIFQNPGWVPLTINGLPTYWNGPSITGSAWNPLAYFNSGSYSTSASQNINLNSFLEYHPHQIKGLSAKVQFGKNNALTTAKQYYPSYTLYTFANNGQNGALFTTTQTGTKNITNSNQLLVGNTATTGYELIGSLNYNRTFQKHNVDIVLVATQNESNLSGGNHYRTTQLLPGIDQFFAFDPSTTTDQNVNNVENGNLGYVVRANYDYAGKYLVQFIDRLDGSSNFAPDVRFGNAPAVAVGWRASEEEFFKKYFSKYVNSLKFRYNIGIVGDDRVNPFLYKARFTPYSGTALFGTTITNGLDATQVPNPFLTWEHARQQTFGIDASFLNDRLTVSAEFWTKHYYDGLVDLNTSPVLPGTFGVGAGELNYNEANTWGKTFSVSYVDKIGKNFGWSAAFNFGWGDSQSTKLQYGQGLLGGPTEYKDITLGGLGSKYNGTNYGLIAKGIIRTQADLDAILAKNPNYTIDGKTPQVGWMDFVDINGDGKITANNDEGPMFESTAAAFSTGWTLGCSYKTLRFNINGFLQLGGKVTVSDKTPPNSATVNSTGSLTQPVYWIDHWTPTNPNAAYPRTDAVDLSENSTFWIRSGTRLYINNATLSYSLPKNIADRLKIPNLRFVLTGENLWAIINPFDYKDVRQPNIQTYPTLRTFSLGVNLTL